MVYKKISKEIDEIALLSDPFLFHVSLETFLTIHPRFSLHNKHSILVQLLKQDEGTIASTMNEPYSMGRSIPSH